MWSRDNDMLAWLWCHNEPYERLAGVVAVNRVDNPKDGDVARSLRLGRDRAYACAVGFHVEACEPARVRAEGKVEAKVGCRGCRSTRSAGTGTEIEELQAVTDERLAAWSRRAICPATPKTVHQSWEPLPAVVHLTTPSWHRWQAADFPAPRGTSPVPRSRLPRSLRAKCCRFQ